MSIVSQQGQRRSCWIPTSTFGVLLCASSEKRVVKATYCWYTHWSNKEIERNLHQDDMIVLYIFKLDRKKAARIKHGSNNNYYPTFFPSQ